MRRALLIAIAACGKPATEAPTPTATPVTTTCYQGITELPFHVIRPSGEDRVATTLRRTVDPSASTIVEEWRYDGSATPDERIYRVDGARFVVETNGRRIGEGALAGPRWAWTGATTYVQLPGSTSRTRIITRITADRYRSHAQHDGAGTTVIVEDLATVAC